jgi:hypothetical protein
MRKPEADVSCDSRGSSIYAGNENLQLLAAHSGTTGSGGSPELIVFGEPPNTTGQRFARRPACAARSN